jgi:hypothetical protein
VLVNSVAAVLALLFADLSMFNAWTVIDYRLTGRHASAIPFIGGIAGAIAAGLLPPVQSLWWIPLFVDYGSVPMLIYFSLSSCLRRVKGSSERALHQGPVVTRFE